MCYLEGISRLPTKVRELCVLFQASRLNHVKGAKRRIHV